MQGDELRQLRKAAGLTQGELAKRLGLTETFIGMMERGAKPIELRTQLAARQIVQDVFFVTGRTIDGRYAVARRTIERETSQRTNMATMMYGIFRRRDHAFRWAAALGACNVLPRPTRYVAGARAGKCPI
ncbi:helix-turn-helix domain-containing protein [Allosphingosinicella indica]|uniref:Helix-turn-helix domain-containing protein n=1 Tax=Allosphingosinicella indica TaxID=941907 RepID=A0A1X7GIV8_9SPHN|nr:helix-turn-helix transcriptional regulator [Allosphingosinicella indica]SMF70471.1 Helix-turn-helix domain-containing protein [Allosphingosinicella indica]